MHVSGKFQAKAGTGDLEMSGVASPACGPCICLGQSVGPEQGTSAGVGTVPKAL